MSEPNVYEQLAGVTIERDAAQAQVARVKAVRDKFGAFAPDMTFSQPARLAYHEAYADLCEALGWGQ